MIEAHMVEFAEGIDLKLTRVVDEQGERADRIACRRDELRHFGMIGEIGGNDRSLAAVLGNLAAQRIGRSTRTVAMDRHRVAGARERARNRAPSRCAHR